MFESRMRVRTRLTLWYIGMLGAVLLVFFGTTAAVMYWQLWKQLNRYAVQDLETVEGLLWPAVALTNSQDLFVLLLELDAWRDGIAHRSLRPGNNDGIRLDFDLYFVRHRNGLFTDS